MGTPLRTHVSAAAVTATMLCGWSVASAETAEQFYRGKTVTLQIGYGPGGGYDLYARELARFYGRHIPGEPAETATDIIRSAGR